MNKKKIQIANILNITLAVFISILWINIFFVHGMAGVVSWSLVKLILAPLGIILSLICCVILLVKILKKKAVSKTLVLLVLSLILAFPMLMLFNIVPMAYPVDINKTTPFVTIHSPFLETTEIGWGGDKVEENAPHAIWASERWAYDIVMKPYDMGSDKLEDYGIYDKKLYAPISGEVIAVFDAEEDIEPNTEEFKSMEGNYVYIKIDQTGTFLLMNHLKKDSIEVKAGDKVKLGDYLGKIGNTGSTSEPHLHIHHQRQDPTQTAHPILAEGLPLYFFDKNGDSYIPVRGEKLTIND